MKRLISLFLLIFVIAFMAGCSSDESANGNKESVSVNLIPIYSHARMNSETGLLNFYRPFRDYYLVKGWSAPYVLEEGGTSFIAAIGKESLLRYNVFKPTDRWLVFNVNNDGKYGGPNWQEMQVFAGEQLLGKYEIRKEEQEIRVHIPKDIQVVGQNYLTFKFSILYDNPVWMDTREKHSDFPFPFICCYFHDFKIITDNTEYGSQMSVPDETDAFKLIVDDKYLSQATSSTITYAFDIHEKSSLVMEGTVQSEHGDEETVAFDVSVRTDDEPEWKSLWAEDVAITEGIVTESFASNIDLAAYAGKTLEFKISAISSLLRPTTTVVWKTLSLDVAEPPAAAEKKAEKINIKDKAKNVVIIILDAARWDRYGMNGSDLQATTNIDKFAEEGLVFENPLAAAPYTITSVSSLFSGLLPEAHNVRRISQVFSPDLESLPKAFKNNGYYTLCLSGSKFVTPQFGLATDFHKVVPMRRDEYKQEQVSTMDEEAIKTSIAAAAKEGKPLFMYAHFLPPHWPYRPPAPYDSFYTNNEEVKMRKAWMVKSALDYDLIPPDNKDIYVYERRYFNNLRYGDHVVQTVLNELKANGLYDDSIIIITSDHGESFGEHKQFGHNTTVYEHMIKVPMAVKVPGTAPGRIKQQVGLIDIFPTLIELMDLKVEDPKLHGRSLAHLFTGAEETEVDNYYYARTNSPNYYFMMRGEKYKYIHAEFNEYLFDIQNDPEEKNNIIDQHPALATKLRLQGLMMIAVNEKRGANIGKEADLSDEDEEELKNLGYLQ